MLREAGCNSASIFDVAFDTHRCVVKRFSSGFSCGLVIRLKIRGTPRVETASKVFTCQTKVRPVVTGLR